jgi:hypothetical protein
MAFEIKPILQEIESIALTLGLFEQVNTHEPKNTPGNGLTAAIWAVHLRPVPERSGLDRTSVRLQFSFRIYTNMLQEENDGIDIRVIEACDRVMGAFTGKFTLNGTVAFIDLLGETGEPMNVLSGYLEIGGKMYRIVTIDFPFIIDDAWQQVA